MKSSSPPLAADVPLSRLLRLLGLALICGTTTIAHGAGQLAWARPYEIAGDARGLVLDSQGNSVSLIDTEGDFSVVKYSAQGERIWAQRYDSPLLDAPHALAVDASDAIYVAVIVSTNRQAGSLQLLKYAPGGVLLWSRDADIPDAQALSITATHVGGVNRVLVAAMTPGGYSILKYDADGTRLWKSAYALPNQYPSTRFFGADPQGNAVLVANINTLEFDKLVILRTSPNGTITTKTHFWKGADDFSTAATLDANGDLYVTGAVRPANSFRYHVYTARYNTAGALIWSATRPPGKGYHAVGQQIAVDSSGQVVVTSYEREPVSDDDDVVQTVTLKYSSSGEPLWSARAQGFDRGPVGLRLDRENNIYVVAANSFGGGSQLIKYRPNGAQSAEIIVPGHNSGNLAVGNPGEVYLLQGNGQVETRKYVFTETPSSLSATIEPALTEVLAGTTVTLSAVVSGPGPYTYQWRHFGYNTGGTGPTLTIPDVQFDWRIQGEYTVTVSNGQESTTSPEARLVVLRPPTVQLTPPTQFAALGEATSFRAIASGTEPIFYSWHFNGEPIAGVHGDLLELPSVRASHAGAYSVVVSNRAGSVTHTSILHVVQAPLSFTNTQSLVISTNPPATDYPSELVVSGVSGAAVKVTVTLHNLQSTDPSGLAILLQAPNGSSVMILSFAGDDNEGEPMTITLDDSAAYYFGEHYSPAGIYRPGLPSEDPLPAPAPLPPWQTSLAEMLPSNPNGTWRLFAAQREEWYWLGPSSLAGWSLTFQQSVPPPQIISIVKQGGQIQIRWNGGPGWKLQRSRTLSPAGAWSDIPGTANASEIVLPIEPGENATEFFRVVP
jgi:hypothetical protein